MPGPVRNANDQPDPDPRLDPRPGARSARRTWLLAGALSLAAHGAILIPVLLARAGPPPPWLAAAPSPPVMVTLFRPPPPRPTPEPVAADRPAA